MHDLAIKIGTLNENQSEEDMQQTLKKLELLLITDVSKEDIGYLIVAQWYRTHLMPSHFAILHTHTHTRTHTHTHTHTLGTTGTFLLTIWHANITFHKQIQNLSTPSHKERVHTWLLYNFHTKNMQLVWDWFLSMSHCILCHKNMSKDKMGIDKAYIWCTLDFSGFVTPSPTYQINVRQYCLIYVKGHNKRSLAALLETQVTLSLQE